MKFTLAEIDTRIRVKRNTADDVQNFDIDNAYPQRVDYAIAASPRGRQCVSVYGKFMRGAGYTDQTLYKAVLNDKGLTGDQFIRALSEDLSKFRGVAIHVDYNALGQIVGITPLPFKEVRLGLPDEDTGMVLEAVHHPDWSRELSRNFKKEKMKRYRLFDPSKVSAQFRDFKDAYSGQVFYWTPEGVKYPLASVDSVLEDLYSDNEAKQFRFTNITTNFLASHIVQTDEMASDNDRAEFMKTLAKFQGARNGRKIMHIEKKQNEQTFELKKLDIQENDQLFANTETAVRENIRSAFLIPPVLVGDLIAGKMGTAKELEDATIVYNGMTYDERLVIEEITRKLVELMPSPRSICPSGDYSIKPLQFNAHGQDAPVAQKTSETVAAKIVEVATSATIPVDKKIAILTRIYGLSAEEAQDIATQGGAA